MGNKRLETTYTQGKFKIIRDNETGVLYMLASSNMNGAGGLTVMIDQEGNPLIDEDFKK